MHKLLGEPVLLIKDAWGGKSLQVELFLLDNGISNKGFHYYGSAKFFGQVGKAFAEALVDLTKS